MNALRGPFENRHFRRLFVGRVVTNVGDSLYFIAAMWLVYSLTGDPLYSGIAGFVTLAPSALQFLAGPLVDRWSIRRILVGTQTIQAVVVLVVPVAHLLGVLTAELILVVMPILSALNQLVYPAQTAALPRLLEDEELVAANSAFSLAYQGLEMVANGIGGVLIGIVGAVALFALDAITFGVAAVVFATVVVPPAEANENAEPESSSGDTVVATDAVAHDGGAVDSEPSDGRNVDARTPDGGPLEGDESDPYLERLRTGASFLRGTFLVWLVVGAAAVNFTSGMVLAAMPAYADSLAVPSGLEAIGDAGAYGILMAAFAAGNLVGAVGASFVSDRRLGPTMIVGFAATGILWSAGIAVDWLPGTAALLTLASVPIGVINVQLAALIQSAPPEALVGRISSVLGSASSAAVPVGALVGGAVAGAISPAAAMAGFGLGAIGLACYVLLIPELRALPSAARVSL